MPDNDQTEDRSDLSGLVWLTRAETGRYLRVHTRTVDAWADAGRITRHKVEGIQSVRFKREELDALMVPESGPICSHEPPCTVDRIAPLDPFRE